MSYPLSPSNSKVALLTLGAVAVSFALFSSFSHFSTQAQAVVLEIDGRNSCTDDVMDCGGGVFVSRDPNNNCEFKLCPEEGGAVVEPSYIPLPTIRPTARPSAEPTPEPTPVPTPEPTPEPTPIVIIYNRADFNKDGKIDAADYAILKADFIKVAAGLVTDLNTDGRVDIKDFTIFLTEMRAAQ